MEAKKILEEIKSKYPEKFTTEEQAFKRINRGNKIFIGTACGEPQYLVGALINYVNSHPKAFFDAEVMHVWTLGLAPYAQEKFKQNFRHNSFFIGNNTRKAVNEGLSDYTPVFLSRVPDLFNRKLVPVDIALIQTSMPDEHGYFSLGVSVDITKTAVENAKCVIAQVNANMPRVHGDSFIHISDIDYVVPFDEPLLEYNEKVPKEIADKLGKYVARIVEDGDTIQVGYGSTPNSIIPHLRDKKRLGVHTELLTEGVIELIKEGVITNTEKSLHRGKTVASFCMASKDSYEYIDDNPTIEFRRIDYVNNPLVIARNNKMTAINSALQIDLTGQATAESIGNTFYSGIGGSADFMRGALYAPGGKTILVMQSTALDGEVSRIVPSLDPGAGVTLTRGDIQYVVTEYGIAYLIGKNVRERAMELIAIAHPKFRPWLIEMAKERNLIYKDQAYLPESGSYPEDLETHRKMGGDLEVLLRPVKISDEPLVKDLFYSLSDNSMYRRFISARKDMPHERLQEFVVIDYKNMMVILAVIKHDEKEEAVGLGQYSVNQSEHTAEVAFIVKDQHQNKGLGTELLAYLTYLAVKQGILGFTAEVLVDNKSMIRVLEKSGFKIAGRSSDGMYELRKPFRQIAPQ
ncbi:MAG: GNAT family N-acetyltransferase [bacterium]